MAQPSPLADSSSPFLQHGAEQPVAWRPWGAAALEEARASDRPILLDIGAVWCHWCHVMDRESYEDAETAALINELYVPVKVDRDERPDVDARYQRAVQALVGQGGWPLTAFLTPDGEVFHGGTYFPPEDAHGRPSFRRVLREVARVWEEDRDRVDAAADAVAERLDLMLTGEAGAGELGTHLTEVAIDALAKSYDPSHGGFGGAPKFPNAGAVGILLDRFLDDGSELARGMVSGTLRGMIAGGIHDQLGGGFHRYSTDDRWIIPHFEKMAYDNGPLLEVLARAAVALGEDGFRTAAEGVVRHYREVAPELVEAGGFHASQDADTGFDDDGDYWTWTEAEVRAALSAEDAEAALIHWGLGDPAGGMHLDPERHVLFEAVSPENVARRLAIPLEEAERRIERARDGLAGARRERDAPFVDRTLYAGWNGLVASGHLAAARHLDLDDAGGAGLRALERVWAEAWTGQGLVHRLGDPDSGIMLADQAHVARALLDAFELTQEPAWIERARAVIGVIRTRFGHPSGGLQDLPNDLDGALGPLDRDRLEITDTPEPSPTAVAAESMARLAALDHDAGLRDAARDLLAVYAGAAPRFAPSAATFFRALRWAVGPITTVAVVEPAAGDGAAAGDLLRAALRSYRPATVVRRLEPGVEPDGLPPVLGAMITGESPRAYVCADQRCAAPVSSPEELGELLRDWR